ncbi:cytochrome c-type biogenesis protein CcmE [archaeon BMS3Abin16]|nr:cytochrome c-type biogenesis protein CcmE [archaeon BMS3Abin16]HDY74810.1 cytochrome c maturation protein CcmE [Euryarchaeota archaeon]
MEKSCVNVDRKSSKKVKLFIGVAVILLLLGMSANSIGEFLNPLKFVSEVTAEHETYMNRSVQVVGFIVESSWQQVGSNSYVFKLTDGNATVDVEFTGDVPGTFKPGIGITVIGTLVSPDKVAAYKLLAKCPSKYEQSIKDTLESKEKQGLAS